MKIPAALIPGMVRGRDQRTPVSFKNKGKSRHRRFSGSRRRKRPHGNNEEKASVEKKYLHSLELYCAARRKYFEFFHRVQGRKLDKLKHNFYRTLEEFRRQEKGLGMKPKGEDSTYSHNHNLAPHSSQESVGEGESEEFYLLDSQKERCYDDDTEESVGTMEDYHAYKGSVQG